MYLNLKGKAPLTHGLSTKSAFSGFIRIAGGYYLRSKFCMVMRMTAFITLVTCLHVSAAGYSQKVSLSVKNTPLQQVFAEIISQTGVSIIYNESSLSHTIPVSMNVKDAGLQQVLDMCVKGQPIVYTINGNNIVIATKKVATFPLVLQEDAVLQHTITVTGRVTDEKGAPIPGATIIVKGAKQGANTNSSGEFVLKNIATDAVITISSIGYSPQHISIEGRTTLAVTLKELVGKLSEMVVVGYGAVKKSDVTGSVARVGEEDIKATPVVDLSKAMQGRAPGVLVTQNSARPGGISTIRIRGTGSVNAGNDPLYVIDGFPTNDISDINPSDIESIEILKDASSTAIYGSRGSNGVVMVTTKRGKKGESNVNFESYYGVQSVRRKIPLLNARQYADFINEARINGGGTAYFDGSSEKQPLPSALGKGTDWQDEVFRQAPIQSYQLSISGGEAKTRYAISGNYYNQEGIVANSNFKRYTLRANLDREVTSRLSIGLSMQGAHTRSNAARTETDGGARCDQCGHQLRAYLPGV
jgi:TonB-dependent SusC/RagA subfamily outer membrane receptor